MKINNENLKLFWYFVNERQNIWHNRFRLKQNFPWTQDEILQIYKFTNVFRILDPGTKFVLTNILGKGNPIDDFFNIIIYRIFNKIETYQEIGYTNVKDFDAEVMIKKINDFKNKGNKIWTTAFMVTGVKFVNSPDKVVNYVKGVIKPIHERIDDYYTICKNTSMENCHILLKKQQGIADFLAYQIMLDCMYGNVLPFKEDTWSIGGNGCKRGLSYVFDDFQESKELEALKILFDMQKDYTTDFKFPGKLKKDSFEYDANYISLSNIENCCCEFSKYYKVKNNLGRPRMKYVAK